MWPFVDEMNVNKELMNYTTLVLLSKIMNSSKIFVELITHCHNFCITKKVSNFRTSKAKV